MESLTVLVKGVEVQISACDADWLAAHTWSVGTHGYVQRWVRKHGVTKCILLHRELLGLRPGDGLIGDHRNGNRLDNRRSNLRIVTASGSSQNVAGRARSGYRGVYSQKNGRWGARVKFQGSVHYLGTYDTPQEAAAVAAAKRAELMPFCEERFNHRRSAA